MAKEAKFLKTIQVSQGACRVWKFGRSHVFLKFLKKNVLKNKFMLPNLGANSHLHSCAAGKGKAEPSFPDIVHRKR